MARTEKKFGQVVEPAVGVNNELVASSLNRRNLAINITARSSAKVSITTFTSAPSYAVTGLALSASEIKTPKNAMSRNPAGTNYIQAAYILPNSNSLNMVISAATSILADNAAFAIQELSALKTADLISSSTLTYVPTIGSAGPLAAAQERGFANLGFATEYQGAASVADNRTTFTPAVKGFGDNLFVVISANSGTATTLGTQLAFAVDTTSATSQWDARGVSLSAYSASHRAMALHSVYSTSADKRCGVQVVYPVNQAETTAAITVIPFGIILHQKTTGQPEVVNNVSTFFSGTNMLTPGNVQAALNAFNAMEYNEIKDVYAISHGTITNSIGTATSFTNTGSTAPRFPANAAPAGFRIATATSTTNNAASRFLYSSNVFPSEPTGVIVPTPKVNRNPTVASLKFSPDGNHLAVMYNRDYSGTGDTYSVAVIYSVNSAGQWNHTYSSGPAVKYRGGTADSMMWLPDNSGVVIISGDSIYDTNRYIQFWVPMTGTVSYVHASTETAIGISRYSSGPKINSMFKVPSTTAAISAAATTSILDSSPGAVVAMGILTATGSPGRLVYVTVERSNSTKTFEYLSQIKYVDLGTSPILGSSSSAVPGYVNTVVQDLSIAAGETIQVSNVVVEPSERIYVEADTVDAVDVTAYGVEIS